MSERETAVKELERICGENALDESGKALKELKEFSQLCDKKELTGWVSIIELKKELGVSCNKILSAIHKGLLPYRKINKHYKVNIESIYRFLDIDSQ